jgi:cystathionine beta-lyase
MANSDCFEFDKVIDRRNTGSLKWQKYDHQDIIPLWVADTDFKVAPVIQKAIEARVEHGIFGYTRPNEQANQALVNYYQTKHGCHIEADWVVWVPGVVHSLALAVRSLSKQHRKVLTPDIAYPAFHSVVAAASKQAKHLAMTYDQDRLRVDLDALDALDKSDPQDARVMLFCNPQNPGGAVYSKAELLRIDAYCEANNLVLVSDEIHADIIMDQDKHHIPYLQVSSFALNNSIVLGAASKAFNVAGLGCSWAVIANPRIRQAFTQEMHGLTPEINPLGYAASLAALAHGGPWLSAMNDYLRGNRDYLMAEFSHISGINMLPLESTYLAWLNVTALELDDPCAFFEKAGVGLSAGKGFNDGDYLRLNFGCPRSLLENAIARIKTALA